MPQESQQTRRVVVGLLGLAMAVSAVWLMVSARAETFSGDDLFYYARYIAHGFSTEVGHGARYFFAPHNGHLQVGGKVIYRLLFEIFGAHYWVFRAVNAFALLLSVGLFFVLAAKRVGAIAALAPCILLLFFGYAYEPLIWAFDMHTVFALAFGLAAILVLEREDRLGDVLGCVFLVLAVSMIELGLAFTVGVAVWVLVRGADRWRRCWIFLIPLVLYAIWWAWAKQFHQSSITLLNAHLIPIDVVESLGAIAGSVTGLNPTDANQPVQTVGVTAVGIALATLAIFLLARYAVRRGGVSPTFWAFAVTAVAYWATIALGERAPDSSRYILAGTFLVLLACADALRSVRWSLVATAALFVVVIIALPQNLSKFYEGRRAQLNDAQATQVEAAMVELAKGTVEGPYTPGADPAVGEKGGGVFVGLSAEAILKGAENFGPLGESLTAVEAEPLPFREVADATLADAELLKLEPTAEPTSLAGCSVINNASAEEPAYFNLPKGGATLGAKPTGAVTVSVSRFALESSGIALGQIEPGTWVELKAPSDASPKPWRVHVDGPLYICK